MLRYYPFYGRGIGFPFRINPDTGGVVVTEGNDNANSVALSFIYERWTIRENVKTAVNHIAEAVAHILLTVPTEHDTLPEFGSYMYKLLFEPNTYEFRSMCEVYLQTAIARWEKRVSVPKGGVLWKVDGRHVDSGEAPMFVEISFITSQTKGNLISPLVNNRDVRLQEYKARDIDVNGHGNKSRYYKFEQEYDGENISIKLCHRGGLAISSQDRLHRVVEGDTWYSLAWKFYKDIELWYVIADSYIDDNPDLDRLEMSPLKELTPGTVIRIPSRISVLQALP